MIPYLPLHTPTHPVVVYSCGILGKTVSCPGEMPAAWEADLWSDGSRLGGKGKGCSGSPC